MPETMNSILIIIIFIIPGFICEKTFSSFFPRERKQTTYIILESIFLSCVNYALLSWVIVLIYKYQIYEKYPGWFAFLSFIILFASPIGIGLISGKLVQDEKFRKLLQFFKIKLLSPIPKAWDYHFGKGNSYWVLITLNDDTKIGGLLGPNSFASSFPAEEDIYLEALCKVDEEGRFKDLTPGTKGALIERKNIKFIEFFRFVSQGGEDDAKQE